MTRAHGEGPAVAAFGDLEQNIWGVAIAGPQPRVAIGTFSPDGAGTLRDATLVVAPEAGWELASDGLSLTIAPADGQAAVAGDAQGSASGGTEPDSMGSSAASPLSLCRVSGTIDGADGPREATLGGVRLAAVPAGKLDSVRLVAAWFGDEGALAIEAVRPRGAKGQDRDELAVAALGEREGVAIFDPRMSTTYGRDGAPRRIGAELWLGETEDGDQYPRRVAGEATGAAVGDTTGGFSWMAHPLRCHRRGVDGAGIYLLFRP